MSDVMVAREPKMTLNESLKSYFEFSQKHYSQGSSGFSLSPSILAGQGRGSSGALTGLRGFLEPIGKPRALQPIQLLSTAKNIPRSALDHCGSKNRAEPFYEHFQVRSPDWDCGWYCYKYPPFVAEMEPNRAVPQIPFLTISDDLSDEEYARWLSKQLSNDSNIKHLMSKPEHLRPIIPQDIRPNGAEAKFITWENDLRLWVYRLLNYPADFAALLPTFVDTIRAGVTHFGDDFNRAAVSAIYQTCLYEWSFCLIGSKLCNVISNSVKKLDGQIGFRSILLQTLQKDFGNKELYVKSADPQDRKKLRHLAYFMGDLLNNLIITSVDPNDPRAEPKMRRLPFNDHIKELLETLVNVPNVANIKTVCNVLIMGVGPIIELENNNQQLLVPLIDKLRQFASTNDNARQVIDARDSGWRDYVPEEIDIPPSFYDISGCEQEPIFFNDAGIAYLVASTADPDVCRELFY